MDGEFSARPVFGLGANFVLYRPLSPERTRLSLRAARGLMRRERRRAPRIPVNSPANVALSRRRRSQRDPGRPQRWRNLAAERQPLFLRPARFISSSRFRASNRPVRLSGEVAWQDASRTHRHSLCGRAPGIAAPDARLAAAEQFPANPQANLRRRCRHRRPGSRSYRWQKKPPR